MGYNNDQFYNNVDVGGAVFDETDTLGVSRKNWFYADADNPRFIYPDRTVRTYGHTDVFDRGTRVTGKRLTTQEEILKRGFIRSIPRTSGENVNKCQFQFNPQNLTQSVQMSEQLLNFYMQDPGQFAQPLGGNTNMTFTLMFDRSMEINNPTTARYSTQGTTERQASDNGGLANSAQSSNPWETGSPGEVGVLRDIAALYKVIGQGVNTDDVLSRQSEIRSTLKAEYLDSDGGVDDEGYEAALSNIEEMMKINVGNYGLLIPRPVRFMFSALYMVEGYVTGSTVTFTKFNTAYVPIQAMVNLTVNAQHVGFAKKETFTTYSIAAAAEANLELERDEREAAADTYDAAKSELGSWLLQVVDPGDEESIVPDDLANGSLLADGISLSAQVSQSSDLSAVRSLFENGGASLYVNARVKFYTDLVAYEPVGSEKKSPTFSMSAPGYRFSTVEDLDDLATKFYAPARDVALYTAGTQGGKMRLVWELEVTLNHGGNQVQGSSVYRQDFSGSDDFLFTAMSAPITTLAWTDRGDAISTLDVLPDSEVESPGTSSNVGGN